MANYIPDQNISDPQSRKRAIQTILFAYIFFVLPILIWHEFHLPIFYILVLSSLTLIFGCILFYSSIKVFEKILTFGFHIGYEFLVYSVFSIALVSSGFLENRAGYVFLFIFLAIVALFRFVKLKLQYGLGILAIILLTNGLLTFVVLQKMEIFSAYHLFKAQLQFTEVDLSGWKLEEETKILSNQSIPFEIKIPEGMYFHNPEDLGLKDKTGIGQIAGIISASDHDPNSYPLIRIFFFPAYVDVPETLIKDEVWKYIQLLENQGEIEEINEIQPNRGWEFDSRIPSNAFWTFYDIIRPRYAKTGFYFIQLSNGNKLLIHLIENLEKGSFHETKIQSLLDTLQSRL
ncbi:MAG: hypothetical protein O9346_00845 [Leptospiraceae bacterium]|nr:hypothetical protein [Leptospiraceae bacterium]MCZ8344939.1 hypothetical protein [Leptospiraceae bacterium]